MDQLADIIPPVLIIINGSRLLAFGITKNTTADVYNFTYQDENGAETKYTIKDRLVLDDSFWILQAVISLTIWFKLFNLFKVNARTAYLIQMITACVVMILPFLLILFITILAFGSAFIMMTNSMQGNNEILSLREILVKDPGFNTTD